MRNPGLLWAAGVGWLAASAAWAQERNYAARVKEEDGRLSGVVRFTGAAPEMKAIVPMEPCCKEAHSKEHPLRYEMVVVNPNGTLRNVFVYISKGAAGWRFEVPKDPIRVTQKGCRYLPRVQGLIVGQSMIVANEDGTLHNVHGVTSKSTEFNVSQHPNSETLFRPGDPKFPAPDKPEACFRLKCDIHDYMSAYIGVRPNPFFSVTGEDGTYAIEGVPPGTYTVTAWHEFYGNPSGKPKATKPISLEITVEKGKAATLDFEFKP